MNPTHPVLTVPLSKKNEAATARLESLARVLGEGAIPLDSYDSRDSARLARASDFLEKQGEKLLKLAAEHHAILPADVFTNIEPISDETAEVIVYQKKDRVQKVTNVVHFFGYTVFCYDCKSRVPGLSRLDGTPSEYLERLALSNRIFGTDNRFEGVTVDKFGAPHIVTSQHYFPPEKGGWINDHEIDQFMARKGFRGLRRGSWEWYRPADGILIDDAHGGNFKRTQNGELSPIDLIINKIDPEKLRACGWEMSMPLEYEAAAPQPPRFPRLIAGLQRLHLVRGEAAEGQEALQTR